MSKNLIAKFRIVKSRIDAGATMVEYGLMVALIAVVVAVAAGTLGGRIVALFNGITFPTN